MNWQKGLMALKVDMSKAYDRVDWEFLRAMMEQIGFVQIWVNFIIRCLNSISYSVIFNRNK